jgi:hypothetical protein
VLPVRAGTSLAELWPAAGAGVVATAGRDTALAAAGVVAPAGAGATS